MSVPRNRDAATRRRCDFDERVGDLFRAPGGEQAAPPFEHRSQLAVIDGGLREFFEEPAKAWEPAGDGAKGEYRSAKQYPALSGIVTGHFADSMVPLHGYRVAADLRATNELWHCGKTDDGVYGGPGLWFDRETGRIHVRLAHHRLDGLGSRAYRGETDPRKLPLGAKPWGVGIDGRVPLFGNVSKATSP